MDLFTPIVPEIKWHPVFANQIRNPNQWNRAVLNDWGTGFIDRDNKFIYEFQTTFNSCFWELYLNAVLRDRGFSIDFAHPAPDFSVNGPACFIVEAAIASNAINEPPEFMRHQAEPPVNLNEFNRQAIIRLSNALHSKCGLYRKHYASMPHVMRKPFVVALAPFDRPFFFLQCQRAVEALLFNHYVDEEKWITNKEQRADAPKSLLMSVKKDNGADVELGLFQNGSMREISAVIFSNCATWGKVRALSNDPNPYILFLAHRLNLKGSKPTRIAVYKRDYTETLLDGLRVYHNPDAYIPLDPSLFRSPAVMQSYYSHTRQDWIHEQTEGQLLFRIVNTLIPKPPAP